MWADDTGLVDAGRNDSGKRLSQMAAMRSNEQSDDRWRLQQAQICGITWSSMDGTVTVDAVQHVHPFSPAAVRMFGCTAAEITDQPPLDKRMPERFRARHDGLAVHTVTGNRRTEQALRDKEHTLQMLAEGVPACIAMFDLNMHFLVASRRILEVYGLAGTDVIGRSRDEILPNMAPQARDVFRRGLAGETVVCDADLFIGADSRAEWIRWEIAPWFTASGEVGGVLSFREDITERKRAEAGLNAARAEAERANDAKWRFLAAASHDLRQPLSALSLYAKVLEAHVDPAGAPFLRKLRACSASLGRLLTNLLDLSKLQAGVVQANPSDIRIADMLLSVVADHEAAAALKGLRLSCVPTKQTARTDPLLFRRIVGNLVNNAVRYTTQGGVLVGCRRRSGKLWVEVWDSGVGIPPDKTGEIFEEFTQLDGGARTRGGGLGLAIVARTAGLLGLEINVRSRPGRGSVFAVELPLGRVSVPFAPQPDIVPSRALRIAFVEDNQALREALTEALQFIGHEVVAADSGWAVCAALGVNAPDIVVSDYRLAGGETGFDVIDTVRNYSDREVPAILITGDTDPNLMRNMASREVVVLHKPLDLETLQVYMDELSYKSARSAQ